MVWYQFSAAFPLQYVGTYLQFRSPKVFKYLKYSWYILLGLQSENKQKIFFNYCNLKVAMQGKVFVPEAGLVSSYKKKWYY